MPLLQEPNKSGARASGTGENKAAGLQREVKLANICEHSPVLTVTLLFSPASFSPPCSARNGASPTTDLSSELSLGARGSLECLNASRCQTHLEMCLSKTQLSRTDSCHGVVFAGVGGQEVQSRADTEVTELGTKPVSAGWCLGRGSCPKAAPIPPTAPRSSLGSTAPVLSTSALGSPGCRDPAPALGSGQGQTVNHGASDATCHL